MYRIVYGLLYLLSLLPLRMLFILSDGLYVLLYYVIGYRRKVVRGNLQLAFPQKTFEERKRIEKQFYKNFIDNFIETLKLLSGGVKFGTKHFAADTSLMEQEYAKGKKLQFYLGHNFNWELANIAVAPRTSYPMIAVYLPVKNQVFEKLMLKIRGVSGNAVVPATDMKNAMLPYRNKIYLLALIADQVPGDPSQAYWMNFFGVPTPFMRGPERGAIAGNFSVMFGEFIKIKRGYYRLEYELCTSEAATMPRGEITRQYVRYLERVITEHPEMWLWSHRRWKKEWRPEYGKLWIDDRHPVP
ncbi:MAG: lysophospholipid acyltransferase family protein [Chitinophagaceae bacterium]|nr:lysophospholipid acyltransferase family protein [Chitinophagaceae bacterium]